MKIYLVGGAVRDALMGMRPDVTLEEDLARRDITINAIAVPAYPMGLTARFAMQKHPATASFDTSWRYQHHPDPF